MRIDGIQSKGVTIRNPGGGGRFGFWSNNVIYLQYQSSTFFLFFTIMKQFFLFVQSNQRFIFLLNIGTIIIIGIEWPIEAWEN